MSKRLTPEQIEIVRHCAWDVDDEERDGINAALARLDYLERKVQAARVMADEFRVGYGYRATCVVDAYDEVTE